MTDTDRVRNSSRCKEDSCHLCAICEQGEAECTCTPCPRCGALGDPECIRRHEHIPDPVLIADAAQARGIKRDKVYNWVRQDWINSFKVADVRSAPRMVSRFEVMNFVAPKKGWPMGAVRCLACGRALFLGHWCPELREAGQLQSPGGTPLGDMMESQLDVVIDSDPLPEMVKAAKALRRAQMNLSVMSEDQLKVVVDRDSRPHVVFLAEAFLRARA